MTYLYLLPFKDGVHFKLGISVSLENRIKQHSNNYDLDLEKSLIVSANESVFILSLEKELLLMLEDSNYSNKLDGYTEIRLMKDFEKALKYIKSKGDFLGFQITDYNNPAFEIKQVKKRVYDKSERLDKTVMDKIKTLRENMGITQKEVADYLEITTKTYKTWEKTDCQRKREILNFLKDYEHKDRFLGLGVSRLSKLLGVNTGNLSVYIRSGREIKGLDKVLADRRSELMGLKVECMRLLVECLEEC